MKFLLRSVVLISFLSLSLTANAGIIAANSNGTFTDDVDGDSGWLNEDTFFNGLDFWTVEIDTPSALSISINSTISFGISIYQGQIANDLGIVFNNDSDFFDFTNTLSYVQGTNAFAPGAGNNMLADVNLTAPGFYTIAVGGNQGFQDNLNYSYDITFASTQVPEPSSILLLSLAGLGLLRRFK